MKIINEGSVKVNVTNLRLDCVAWIKDQFNKKFPTAKAVLGISGGKETRRRDSADWIFVPWKFRNVLQACGCLRLGFLPDSVQLPG